MGLQLPFLLLNWAQKKKKRFNSRQWKNSKRHTRSMLAPQGSAIADWMIFERHSTNANPFLTFSPFSFFNIWVLIFIFVFIFGQITKKCLNATFTSISEDSVDFSPISEISDANHNQDVTVSLNLNVLFPFLEWNMTLHNISFFYSAHFDLFEMKRLRCCAKCIVVLTFENHIYRFSNFQSTWIHDLVIIFNKLFDKIRRSD